MMKYILLIAIAIAAVYAVHDPPCVFDKLTCEWKYAYMPWNDFCPMGMSPKIHAWWGREDNTTCTEEVRDEFLTITACPDSGMAADAATEWCQNPANILQNGKCKIRAANKKVGGDPCVHTFKYLRTCTYCVHDEVPPCNPLADGHLLTCEWKYARFAWDSCPNGLVRKARARWGRDGDNSTCVDQVPWIVLQNLDCSPTEAEVDAASAAVTAWCNDPSHIRGNGDCKIRAANKKVGGDPCVGTFKYLRTCTYCGLP